MRNLLFASLLLSCLAAACSPQPGQQLSGPAGPATPSAAVNSPPGVQPSPQASPQAAGSSQAGASASPQPGPSATAQAGGTGTGTAAALATAASLRLTAPTRFLNAAGETVLLTADVLDVNGQVLATGVPLNWTSSRPGDLSVDANGQVKALIESGFSEITASLPGTNLSQSLVLNVTSTTTGSGGGGGSSAPQPPVIRNFSASSINVVGSGIPVQLSADAVSGTTYSWRCLDEGCSDFVTTNEPTVFWRTPSPAVAGSHTYNLELTETRNGLSSRQQIAITVLTGGSNVTVTTGGRVAEPFPF